MAASLVWVQLVLQPSLNNISADGLCISCTSNHCVCSGFLALIKAKEDPLLGQLIFVLEVLLHHRKILHFTEAAEHKRLNVHVCP